MDGALNIYQYLSATRPKTFALFSLIGILLVLHKIIKRLRKLFNIFIRPKRNLLKRYGDKSWVLITGSSDGINIIIKVLENNLHYHLLKEDSILFYQLELDLNLKM